MRINQHKPEQAIDILTSYLEREPGDQDALSMLLPLLVRSSRYHNALDVYSACERALATEGKNVSASVHNLLLRMRQQHAEALSHISLGAEPDTVTRLHTSTTVGKTGRQYHILSESGLVIATSVSTLLELLREVPMDSKTWFSRGQASIRDEIEHWIGKAARCIPLQESIHRELVAFHNQSPLPASSEEEHRISRRVAIATLAVLPSYLSSPPQQGKKVLLDVEAFLPHCAASVTACWHLLQGGGLATIAYTIPQFLHTLETLAQQSSVYQKAAAHLASQGCLLMGIVAAHRLQFALRETLCTHAVKYSKIADDQVLQVAALAALGEAFLYTNKHDEMLLKCQEALNAVRGLAEPLHPLMRSKALAELARAYALNGKQDEAKHCIDEAYALHSEKLAETPVFLSTDSGIHLLISRKGRTLLELHQRYPKEGYAQDAENALAEIDQHAAITTIPEPWRVGIMRQQAKAALYQGNLSDFQRYLQKSIEGAIALNSSKLRQDAVELYQEVRRPGHKWRNEGAIKDLGDLLV